MNDSKNINIKKKFFTTKNITGTALLGALSGVLYCFVKFPLPFIFPSFLDIQISEIPCLIAGFAYGPIFGIITILIRFISKLFVGSSTYYVGEIGDLLLGLSLVLITSIYYRKHKTYKSALYSLIISSLICTLFAILINDYILIPMYFKLFSKEAVIGLCSIIKGINESNFLYLYNIAAVIPFNLIRYSIIVVLTLLLYKKIKFLLDKIK